MFGPPQGFTPASTCSWLGHRVSGLRHDTYHPFQIRFRFGSVSLILNLASHRNSPARSTKSTTSDWLPVVLCLLVSTRFQVLFHSPPGVLFTFPSRYYSLSVTWSYLALRDGPRAFRQDSSCPDVLRIPLNLLSISPTGLSPSSICLSIQFGYRLFRYFAVLNPDGISTIGLGCSDFARHYSRNRFYFLFLRVLRCFSSPGSLLYPYVFRIGYRDVTRDEFPHSDICGL